MYGVLILATAELKNKRETSQLPRVDYLELNKFSGSTIINYSLYNNLFAGKFLRYFETFLRSDITLGIKGFLESKKFKTVLAMSERVGIPLAFIRKFQKQKKPLIFMFKAWSQRQDKAFRLFNLFSQVDLTIVHSKFFKNFLCDRFMISDEKIKFVPYCAVDQNFFNPIDKELSYIFSLGELRGRDYKTLFKAMEDVDAELKVAASGRWYAREKKPALFAKLANNIEVGGRYLPNQLRDMYAGAYFVVLPIYDVIFSAGATALLEAMAMGKAVIVSKSRGILDYVEDGKTGIFVEPGNPDDLREKIRYLLDHPEEAERLGKSAREKIEKEMNIDIYVEKLANIIKEVENN